MIVSHHHRFIFVKTRKTAGTSIEIDLSRHCGPEDVITRLPDDDEVIRNEAGGRGPQNFDRIPRLRYTPREWIRYLIRGVGAYPFAEHSRARRIRRHVGTSVWERYFTFCVERNTWDKVLSYWHYREGPEGSISLHDYIMADDLHLKSDWERYTENDRVLVDRVIRFEHLADELRAVYRHLGLRGEPDLPRAKGGFRKDRRPYWEVLTDEQSQQIARVFRREIDHFGYRFGEVPA
jgi:hypothetical protein